MEMASTKASLVDTRDFSGGVTATIPRAEFEAALGFEEPPELFLEVAQPDEGEKRDVSVKWSRADLERLLADTPGPAITLAFDRDELERVLAEDVEAHGLREKAAVLSIAAIAAMGGGASTAAAMYDEAGSTARGITPSYVAVHDEAGLTERGIEPTPVVQHDEATLAQRGIEPGTLPAPHDEATLTQRGIEPGTLPAPHDEATLTQRGIEPAPTTPADSGFAIDVPSIDATTAATVGGLAGLGLLITAAGFAVRRQRGTHPA